MTLAGSRTIEYSNLQMVGHFAKQRHSLSPQSEGFADMEQMGRITNFAIYLVCLVGFVASADVAVAALMTAPAPLTGLAASLAHNVLVALPVVGGAFVLRYKQLTQGASPRRREIMRFSECPGWMRAICYTVMLLGVGLFAGSAGLELLGFIPRDTGAAVRVGGFGLVANSFISAQLCSVQRLARHMRNRSRGQTAHQLASLS
jgi:hypothetical protein